MEAQLQNLIEQIKQEGVSEAKKESEKIISQAEEKAKQLIQKAEAAAADTVKKAATDAENFRVNSEKAIHQAARNMILGLQDELVNVLDNALKDKVKEAMTPAAMKDIIVKFVENRTTKEGKGNEGIEVLLSSADKKALEGLIKSSLKAKVKNGIELKPVEDITGGFMIGEKNGSIHYDITVEGISEILQEYLNPKLRQILGAKKG